MGRYRGQIVCSRPFTRIRLRELLAYALDPRRGFP